MNPKQKQGYIRSKARENQVDALGEKVLWSRHGIIELVNEHWQRVAVEAGLTTCEVIEDYKTLHRPLPDCLVPGWLASGEAFHAVVAIDLANDRIFLVTVYKPSKEEWEDDWRTRRR